MTAQVETKKQLIYEIINPSDPYTMAAESRLVACLACGITMGGAYALECLSDPTDKGYPMMLFGADPKKWFAENFGIDTPEKFAEAEERNWGAIADALDSVLIGSLDGRGAFAYARMTSKRTAGETPEAHGRRVRDEWHEQRRSSMNDIGARCWENARRIREFLSKKAGPA